MITHIKHTLINIQFFVFWLIEKRNGLDNITWTDVKNMPYETKAEYVARFYAPDVDDNLL